MSNDGSHAEAVHALEHAEDEEHGGHGGHGADPNDGVVEGIRLLDAPAFGVQYHPEAAPGPHDADDLFDEFCALMEGAKMTAGRPGSQHAAPR